MRQTVRHLEQSPPRHLAARRPALAPQRVIQLRSAQPTTPMGYGRVVDARERGSRYAAVRTICRPDEEVSVSAQDLFLPAHDVVELADEVLRLYGALLDHALHEAD